jgi:cytidylate kinase
VRLVGSRERRIERLKAFYGLNGAEAAVTMKKSDAGRRGYVKRYFGKSIEDPLLYDLVVNTDRVPYHDAARLIAERLATKPARRSRS